MLVYMSFYDLFFIVDLDVQKNCFTEFCESVTFQFY